jgi:predicted Fe-Mo cluster-binding NifX family protein
MKIAITAKEAALESEVDPRFGRAPYILIVDTGTMEYEVVDNRGNAGSFKGAGIAAASGICGKGAEVLLTGSCGPKAFMVLDAAGIKVVNNISGRVGDMVAAFRKGGMRYATGANKDAHW